MITTTIKINQNQSVIDRLIKKYKVRNIQDYINKKIEEDIINLMK